MSEYDPCPVVVDISNKEKMESDLYGYAMCGCTTYGEEAIRINRPFESRFVVFDCPRCGEKRVKNDGYI